MESLTDWCGETGKPPSLLERRTLILDNAAFLFGFRECKVLTYAAYNNTTQQWTTLGELHVRLSFEDYRWNHRRGAKGTGPSPRPCVSVKGRGDDAVIEAMKKLQEKVEEMMASKQTTNVPPPGDGSEEEL